MKIWIWLVAAGLVCVRLSLWSGNQARVDDFCTERLADRERRFEAEGVLLRSVKASTESAELFSVRILEPGKTFSWPGKVKISGLPPETRSGEMLRFKVAGHCDPLVKNPSVSLEIYFRKPTLHLKKPEVRAGSEAISLAVRARLFWSERLRRVVGNYPQLHILSAAVFWGELSALPKPVSVFYREAGLSAVLALSGQHVCICTALVLWVLQFVIRKGGFLFRGLPFQFRFLRFRSSVPFLCALILAVLSLGIASMQRTAWVCFSSWALRSRARFVPLWRIVTSSTAIAWIVDPALMIDVGFYLSALGCAVSSLGLIGTEVSGWRKLFLPFWIFSILMVPVIAFFFCKWSGWVFLGGILLTLAWELFWIPLGFAVPIAAGILPGFLAAPILTQLDRLFAGFLNAHRVFSEGVRASYLTVVGPTWYELILIEICFLVLLVPRRAQ